MRIIALPFFGLPGGQGGAHYTAALALFCGRCVVLASAVLSASS
jgi:hypothetical protein